MDYNDSQLRWYTTAGWWRFSIIKCYWIVWVFMGTGIYWHRIWLREDKWSSAESCGYGAAALRPWTRWRKSHWSVRFRGLAVLSASRGGCRNLTDYNSINGTCGSRMSGVNKRALGLTKDSWFIFWIRFWRLLPKAQKVLVLWTPGIPIYLPVNCEVYRLSAE